jgi:hypothetical protein
MILLIHHRHKFLDIPLNHLSAIKCEVNIENIVNSLYVIFN